MNVCLPEGGLTIVESILKSQSGIEAGETLQSQDGLFVEQFKGKAGPGLAECEDGAES